MPHPCAAFRSELPLSMSSPPCPGKQMFTPMVHHPTASSWRFLVHCLEEAMPYTEGELAKIKGHGRCLRGRTSCLFPRSHPVRSPCLGDNIQTRITDNSGLDKTKVEKTLRHCGGHRRADEAAGHRHPGSFLQPFLLPRLGLLLLVLETSGARSWLAI